MAGDPKRHITYCIVPAELARELHDPLRRHFKRDKGIEIVIERRGDERRAAPGRRGETAEAPFEQRQIRAPDGRRVADRRAAAIAIEPSIDLPAKLARHLGRLRFVERFAPADEYVEDQDSTRLVLRVQGGDFEAFAALYHRYFDRVYAYLSIGLGDQAGAEEAAQDTFGAVIEALPDYVPSSLQPFRAWLFELAGQVAAEALTAAGGLAPMEPARIAQRRAAEAADDPRVWAMAKLSDRELLHALEYLPQRERQVVMLRYMLGLTNREIAGVLGCTTEDAQVLRYNAMYRLSDALPRTFRARDARDTSQALRSFGSAGSH